MDQEIINFITWNVNGLKEQREQKLTELRNSDVVFLQETHIGEGDDNIITCIEDEWHIFYTKYTPSQKGTAILVRKTLDFKCISVEKDNCGGYVVLKCKLKGQLYTLLSIYIHQTDTETLDKLARYLQSMTTGLLVIGGDFNTVLNPFIDKKCKTNRLKNNRVHHKLFSCVKKFMKSLQLVDIWRRKNPVKQNYTYHKGNIFSRLDYFFTPEECLWRVTSCDIRDLERPDHQPLFLKINNVFTDTSQKNLQIHSLSQLLSHKHHLGIEMTASSSVQDSELSEVDIVSALHSLQVSDTPRPDGIPVSFYKENIQIVIPYIKMLYNMILSGTFNCSERRFNESVRSPHDNSQHFFNVDYIIIATILARRLEDFLESQSERRTPKESVSVLITPKTLHTQTMLGCIEKELEKQRESNLFQNFSAVTSLGCPLTSVLVTLALKCYASQLFQDLEKHLCYIFKLSVIVCFLPEDQVKVHAIVTNRTDEEYDILMIRRGNSEPFHLTSVGSEPEVWDGEESDESDDILYCFTLPPDTCKIMYAVVTLQESKELTVIPTNWLNEHKTQCHWPPFRTPEKCLEVIKNRHEPARGAHSWELLNIVCHWEHDTYILFKEKREAVSEQVERMYAVVTLQESKELTVIPTNWLNEDKTQCYWPPFRTPEKCLEVIKNRHEPARGINAWQQLNIVFYGEYAAYRQAKEKREAVSEQMERPSTSLGGFEKQKTINPIHAALTSQSTQTFGVKRKRYDEDISRQSLLITAMDQKKKAKQIMEEINVKVQAIQDTDPTITTIKTHILDAISKMNEDTRKKETIGIFGRTGEGKSSLLNAVLREKSLLPSGGFGACTASIIQVEANLNDSNYIAEIEFISKEECDVEFALSDGVEENQLTEMTKERISALFGAEAEEKTLEELKRDDKYKDIFNVLSTGKKIISRSDPSAFARDVVCYIENSEANPGGWYWPLVKSVTIKIPNCRELLEHIVLIDLPGTGDCNKIRDDLWKTKIRECSAVWIVSDIKRAITDRDPWGILDHCIEDLGPGGECKHINFICTKTDDMKPEEYLRSAKLTEAQTSGHGLDVKTKCILHRNDLAQKTIKLKLKSTKSQESKERFITDVFTVSSTAFFEPELKLKDVETEIPKLRDILINRNKSINHKLTRDYINEAKGILSLLQSVQLDKDKNMTKARILKDLQTNLEENLKLLDDHFEDLYEKLKKCLSKGVEESVRSCVKTTQDMLSSVRPKSNRGFHQIFRAMCCRGGFYWPTNWNEPLDLNKFLSKHMYGNINKEFELMFPVDDNDKTEKSMQDKLDKFSIILPTSPMLHPIHIFIQTQETKLKTSLSRVIVEKKKEIYLSIYTAIERKMAPGFKKAAEVKGEGSMQRMENIIMETIDELKVQMFNEAKVEMLEMFNNLKLHIMKTLESDLKSSVKRSLSQISKFNLLDVSREIQELEIYQQQFEVKQEPVPLRK